MHEEEVDVLGAPGLPNEVAGEDVAVAPREGRVPAEFVNQPDVDLRRDGLGRAQVAGPQHSATHVVDRILIALSPEPERPCRHDRSRSRTQCQSNARGQDVLSPDQVGEAEIGVAQRIELVERTMS